MARKIVEIVFAVLAQHLSYSCGTVETSEQATKILTNNGQPVNSERHYWSVVDELRSDVLSERVLPRYHGRLS